MSAVFQEPISTSPAPIAEDLRRPAAIDETTRELLERHFDPHQIRQRKGDEGQMYSYIEGAAIVQRLNDVFKSAWSFEVLEHRILDNEVVVLGKLLAGGIEKMQFGASQITRRTKDKSIISIGDDLKKAATDALKKCATLFGVGLQLYFKEAKPEERKTPAARPTLTAVPRSVRAAESHRVTTQQLSEILAYPAKAARPATPPQSSVADCDRATVKQVSAIVSLASLRGWTKSHLFMECNERMPDQLTKDQAGLLINRLQLQQGARV